MQRSMLEGSDGGGGAAAGEKHPIGEMSRTELPRYKARKVGPDKLGDACELNFAALEVYASAHDGDPNCPENYEVAPAAGGASAKPLRLGRWLSRQREAYKEGKLDKTRKQRLTDPHECGCTPQTDMQGSGSWMLSMCSPTPPAPATPTHMTTASTSC